MCGVCLPRCAELLPVEWRHHKMLAAFRRDHRYAAFPQLLKMCIPFDALANRLALGYKAEDIVITPEIFFIYVDEPRLVRFV